MRNPPAGAHTKIWICPEIPGGVAKYIYKYKVKAAAGRSEVTATNVTTGFEAK